MKFKKLKGWKKGGIIGLLIGLIIGILFLPGDSSFETIIIQILFILILPLTLIGIYIGFLNSIKNKYIGRAGIIGLITGLFLSTLLLTPDGYNLLKWLAKPIFNLHYLITGCTSDCYDLIFIYPIVFIILFNLIGILIGFILGKLRK